MLSNHFQAAIKEEFADTSLEGLEMDNDGPHEEEELEMPPSPILYKLVDRLENQLPKDDTVKYDSRCKKIDWKIWLVKGVKAAGPRTNQHSI